MKPNARKLKVDAARHIVYPDNYRTYVVLADTVQNPVDIRNVFIPGDEMTLVQMSPMPDTITIAQPSGRQAAQVGHVVGRMRDRLLRDFVLENLAHPQYIKDMLGNAFCQDVTNITLSARNSYELHHVMELCQQRGIRVFPFPDTNPEYGEGSVVTAFVTEPIDPMRRIGVLDYLPLWGKDIT
jgi:hypothetical protein